MTLLFLQCSSCVCCDSNCTFISLTSTPTSDLTLLDLWEVGAGWPRDCRVVFPVWPASSDPTGRRVAGRDCTTPLGTCCVCSMDWILCSSSLIAFSFSSHLLVTFFKVLTRLSIILLASWSFSSKCFTWDVVLRTNSTMSRECDCRCSISVGFLPCMHSKSAHCHTWYKWCYHRAQHLFMATYALPESPGTSKDMVSHTGYIHYPSDSSTENNDCYLEHCKWSVYWCCNNNVMA